MSENAEVVEKQKTICGLTEDKISKMEEISQRFQLENQSVEGHLRKSLLIAEGVRALDELVTDDVMIPIMYLMGKGDLGFVTDKDRENLKNQYTTAEVKPVFIESQLRGLMPSGNQWNILVGKLYITKNGYTHILNHIPGFTDLFIDPQPAVYGKEYATIDFDAAWKMNGIEQKLSGTIPVHVNRKGDYVDKIDGIMGKADRKIKYRIHCQVTNTKATESDEIDRSEMNNQSVKQLTSLEQQAEAAKEAANVQ